MIKCEYYPNHHCCKHFSTCEFWIPVNESYSNVLKELSFELKHLKETNHRLNTYFKVAYEIKNFVYSKTLCIKGRLIRVPKINAKGDYIFNPEDVIVGLNYNVISQEIKDTESIIRELRREENRLLKILKKRGEKYD